MVWKQHLKIKHLTCWLSGSQIRGQGMKNKPDQSYKTFQALGRCEIKCRLLLTKKKLHENLRAWHLNSQTKYFLKHVVTLLDGFVKAGCHIPQNWTGMFGDNINFTWNQTFQFNIEGLKPVQMSLKVLKGLWDWPQINWTYFNHPNTEPAASKQLLSDEVAFEKE